MGVTELARRQDLLPSDVHRILNSLAAYGFIEQNAETKTYRLGMGVMKLGLAVFQRNELRQAARPLLKRVSDDLEVSAHMAIFDPHELEIFLVEQIDTAGQVPFKPNFGAVASPHSTALGKAITAHLDTPAALDLIRKFPLVRSTSRTITQLPQLEAELHATRSRGYGVDLEESAEGACCIGAPIRDGSGKAIAAVSLSMPARTFFGHGERELASVVRKTAESISRAAQRTFAPKPMHTGDPTLGEFVPFLRAARFSGVGRQTTWGKGEVEVVQEDRGARVNQP